jgi:hypothetical protein
VPGVPVAAAEAEAEAEAESEAVDRVEEADGALEPAAEEMDEAAGEDDEGDDGMVSPIEKLRTAKTPRPPLCGINLSKEELIKFWRK